MQAKRWNDYGLFAIAIATVLAFGSNPDEGIAGVDFIIISHMCV